MDVDVPSRNLFKKIVVLLKTLFLDAPSNSIPWKKH
jgi:hypothetical protein